MSARRNVALLVAVVLAAIVLVGVVIVQLVATDDTPVPPDTDRRLRWAPPALVRPERIAIPADGIDVELDPDRDYVLVFPDAPVTGRVHIVGGDDIVAIGGSIVMHEFADAALEIERWHGVLHVEGLTIDPGGDRGVENDGIRLHGARDGSVAQLQNVRVDRVTGTRAGAHGDVVQTWAGPATLRIDRLTGFSDYQGLWLQPGKFDHPVLDAIELHRVDLHMVARKGWVLYGIDGTGNPPAPRCSDVYADMGSVGRWSEQRKRSETRSCVDRGPAPRGEYVPAAAAGARYVSPGYRTARS